MLEAHSRQPILNVLEEALSYAALIRDAGLTQEQCAAHFGKDRSSIANALRLLTLPEEIRADLADGRLGLGHGRALLSLDSTEQMLAVRDAILAEMLSVRKTELLCRALKNKDKVATKSAALAAELSIKLGTKVEVEVDEGAAACRVTIEAKTPEALATLLRSLVAAA